MGNSQRHENPKDSEAKLSINVILDKGKEVWGIGDPRFQKWKWEKWGMGRAEHTGQAHFYFIGCSIGTKLLFGAFLSTILNLN